jgi:hypothetical protein
VKNHDFTPKNHIFPILGGGRTKFLGYFMWKITILRQKNLIFSNFRGGARRGRAPGAHPPWIRPCDHTNHYITNVVHAQYIQSCYYPRDWWSSNCTL